MIRHDSMDNAEYQQRNYEEHLQLARHFVQMELKASSSDCRHNNHHQIFSLLIPTLTNDPYLALAGLEAGVYQMSDLPMALQSNPHFCAQVVARYSSLFHWSWQQSSSEDPPPTSLDWNILPSQWRHDVNLARYVIRRRPEVWWMLPSELQRHASIVEAVPVYNDALAVEILSQSSTLRHSRTVWHRLIESAQFLLTHPLYELFEEFAPRTIRSCPYIMQAALQVDPTIQSLWCQEDNVEPRSEAWHGTNPPSSKDNHSSANTLLPPPLPSNVTCDHHCGRTTSPRVEQGGRRQCLDNDDWETTTTESLTIVDPADQQKKALVLGGPHRCAVVVGNHHRTNP